MERGELGHGILERMAAHRSVRAFHPTPVPDAHVRRAVEAARYAATSSWIQAYALIQVEERATRLRLRELCGDQEQVERAGAFFVVCGDLRRQRLVAERAGAPRVENLETFLLAVIDSTLFAQNLCLALEAQGYGTCFIGGLRNRIAEVDRLIELPEGVLPLFGLCAGESAEDPGQRPRMPVETIWSKERYPSDVELRAGIEAHDREAAAYYERRGAPGRDWSGGVWRKFRRASREGLAGFYRSKGASLE